MIKLIETVKGEVPLELGVFLDVASVQKHLAEIARDNNCQLSFEGGQAILSIKGEPMALYEAVNFIPVHRRAGIRTGILQEVRARTPVVKFG